MKLVKVTSANIKDLFEINRQLALEEGQADLFTASLDEYQKGFVGTFPTAVGYLAYESDNIIGFAVCNYKFATYVASNVLYIEDLYLKPETVEDKKEELLQSLVDMGFSEGCRRVEMRVMNNFEWGFEVLEILGFARIDKWSVYRISR